MKPSIRKMELEQMLAHVRKMFDLSQPYKMGDPIPVKVTVEDNRGGDGTFVVTTTYGR